ncbi:hypothetical protein OROMI_000891 [Orobanche minor]
MRPEKYIGDLETWYKAEAALTEALNEFDKDWLINEGHGAFYGPKIDISVSDARKRKFQCATLQLDFQLPSHFNLKYSTEDESNGGGDRHVIIHRAVLGSVERILSILIENYKGKWPLWLSPRIGGNKCCFPADRGDHVRRNSPCPGDANHYQRKGLVLPFEPHSITFDDIKRATWSLSAIITAIALDPARIKFCRIEYRCNWKFTKLKKM